MESTARNQSSRTTESLDGELKTAISRALITAGSAAGAVVTARGALTIAGAGGWGFVCSAGAAGAAGTRSQQSESCGAQAGPGADCACSAQQGGQIASASASAPGSAQSASASASSPGIRDLIAMER
jgi:hypothetical protein